MTMPLLQVKRLSVTVGETELLSDVLFELNKGECLGLVGESGSGKSITCRTIIGLLGRIGGTVTSGEVALAGTNLLALADHQWRSVRGKRIAFVPQSSMSSLDPLMRVGAQLRETVRALEPSADARERSRDLLESVHMPRIDHVLRAYPHELSGGMRQRVMIAFALAGSPELLVADEPTTALDATVQRGILELLAEIRENRGLSVLLVTHDMATVSEMCDAIAVMYGGRVVEQGRVPAVLAAPAHPYTRALLESTPALRRRGLPLTGVPGSSAQRSVEGCVFRLRCSEATAECAGQHPEPQNIGEERSVSCWNPLKVAL